MADTLLGCGIDDISNLLQNLQRNEYPILPSPDSTKRRASVALVVRIKPSYSHWPDGTKSTDLNSFFGQGWVRHGEPEVLFIKRASRKGDRWTSHIALPGGKRDPGDEDDRAAAVRETWEEVGLDLNEYGIGCGNLPQRIVTTHWGKKALMVLCPYVFLLNTYATPPFRLQPTEVASTHWVPLRSLQSPERRTVVFEDVSNRLANQETGVKRWMLSMFLGKMIFSAIALLPTESLHSAETPAQENLQDNRHAPQTRYGRLSALATQIWRSDIFNQYPAVPPEGPLLLWGLTLGVISDFLDLVPPHNALTLWTYPTFTPLDVRFTVWLMTYRFKERKRAELQGGYQTISSSARSSNGSSEIAHSAVSESTVLVSGPDETGFHGLGTGLSAGQTRDKKAAVSNMLDGFVDRVASYILPAITDRARYYDIVRRAVAVALGARASLAIAMIVIVLRRLRSRGRL